ncbi:MAG: ABC transporter ATP-binding protein [Victivallales bacterium]|nr:ABC transporter ATP-binding protein [Victivallales bacterium]
MTDIKQSDNFSNVITAENLSKIFKDFWNRPKSKAVNKITFNVKSGETIGLLGPNGSGKSTTVKMILGLLYPTSGDLNVFGEAPSNIKTKKLIGYLPEETYLYKYLTAWETLDFFGSLFKIPSKERKKRVRELLNMVGLSNSAGRCVGEFSKGMARRIGLAQTMINNPELIILDEPTSGLDPIGSKEMKELIKLFKKQGKTILICSHLLSDIEDMCDRVILLYGGKIRAEGSLNEILKEKSTQKITVPALSPEATKKLLEILRSRLSEEKIVIDNPRISLESFFLDVIKKANEEKAITSGAESGGKIPDFLYKKNNFSQQK